MCSRACVCMLVCCCISGHLRTTAHVCLSRERRRIHVCLSQERRRIHVCHMGAQPPMCVCRALSLPVCVCLSLSAWRNTHSRTLTHVPRLYFRSLFGFPTASPPFTHPYTPPHPTPLPPQPLFPFLLPTSTPTRALAEGVLVAQGVHVCVCVCMNE